MRFILWLTPPPVLSFITLITYLISLTLVLSCPWLGSAYPSPHLTLPGGDLSTLIGSWTLYIVKKKKINNCFLNRLFVCIKPGKHTIDCYNMKKLEKHEGNTCFFCFPPLVSPCMVRLGRGWRKLELDGMGLDVGGVQGCAG